MTEKDQPICGKCYRLFGEDRKAEIVFTGILGSNVYYCAEHAFDAIKDLPPDSELLQRFKDIDCNSAIVQSCNEIKSLIPD